MLKCRERSCEASGSCRCTHLSRPENLLNLAERLAVPDAPQRQRSIRAPFTLFATPAATSRGVGLPHPGVPSDSTAVRPGWRPSQGGVDAQGVASIRLQVDNRAGPARESELGDRSGAGRHRLQNTRRRPRALVPVGRSDPRVRQNQPAPLDHGHRR